jgi:plasmid segregation protein ParM
MQAIGIDIGYGYTKINTGARVESYPSIVGNCEENRISIGFERHLPEMIEIDGEKFLVGESAKRYSSRNYQVRDRNWINTKPYRVLAKHSLARSGVKGEAVITTGLPVAYHQADKERLARIIQDLARESGIVASVHVLPQPAGSFFSLLFDEKGEILDSRLASQRVGVLDVGFYTTDLITVDGLQTVDKQVATIESGVSTALEAIRRDITDAYNLNDLYLYRVEEAVRRRKISVFGEDQDISKIVGNRLRELEAEIEAQAQTIWGNGADLDRVILAGGGAEMLSPYLNLYRHATVLRDAAAANAAGFYRHSMRKAKA